jgi:hypothetical protein
MPRHSQLRWLAALPVAFLAFAIVAAAGGLATYPLRHTKLMMPLALAGDAIAAFAFVRAGSAMAPNLQLGVSVVFGLLYTGLSGLSLGISITQGNSPSLSILVFVISLLGASAAIFRVSQSDPAQPSARSVTGDVLIGLGFTVLIATLIFGYLAWFVTISGDHGGDLYDGMGRTLKPAPLIARIIVMDRLWAGFIWLIVDSIAVVLGFMGGFSIARLGFYLSEPRVTEESMRVASDTATPADA